MKKFFRFSLIFVMLLLAASWLSSIAYGQTNDGAEQSEIYIEVAPPEAAPSVTFYGRAIGSVTAGDLFYINSVHSPQDISLGLYITNCDELIHYFRYLILKVAVYIEDAEGQWQPVASQNETALPDTYITLQNSPVNFYLPGLARYKVTIESGSYHSHPFHADGGVISPSFYLNVEAR
ncbi:MAG: hypothetical protein JXA17_00835 [Dehalococcoidales bacterium]|nr:hypothetical protein [Dehalococcoidales bacterium]